MELTNRIVVPPYSRTRATDSALACSHYTHSPSQGLALGRSREKLCSTIAKEMTFAAPEENETKWEIEQTHKVDDAPVENVITKEVDEQKIMVSIWVFYRPDDVPSTIYSHLIADPSCFKVPLKLNGNYFSQEQLAECPKLRVGLNFSICETKVPRRTGREAFIVCGFECVSGDHVRVFLCSKVTGLFCSVLLPFGWSYPPGEDIDFFTSKLESFKLFLLENFQIDPTKRNDTSSMFSIQKKKKKHLGTILMVLAIKAL